MRRERHYLRSPRKGAVTVLAAILAAVLVGMVAFCVDIGYVLTAKEELQRSADASALATCWEFGQELAEGSSSADAASLARSAAVQYALLNGVTNHAMIVDPNASNDAAGDVVFGYIADFQQAASPLQMGTLVYSTRPGYDTQEFLRQRRSALFFARVFGMNGQVLTATRRPASFVMSRALRPQQTAATSESCRLRSTGPLGTTYQWHGPRSMAME